MSNSETKWQFYTTSEEAWGAMLESIENAKESINLEQYIFLNDNIGSKFLDLLTQKALQGVRVRILCDTVGSFPIYRSNLQSELQKKGIELRFFNTIVPWSPHQETFWYFRDHKKLLVIDGQVAFTGGVCIADEMKDWRESHLYIKGPVVAEMTSSFEVMWHRLYKKPGFYFKKRKSNHLEPFRYLTNTPLPRKRFIYYELIKAITTAKSYINLTTPYFLPDYKLSRAIKGAARRGVKIKLLVPMYPNHYLVQLGSATYFDEMLLAGIKIFRYKSMIHGKTAVIDGSWASIGSLNLDNISLRYNFEANLVSADKNFVFDLEKQFMEDLKSSEELFLPHWRERSWFQKFLEFCIWPIRKLL